MVIVKMRGLCCKLKLDELFFFFPFRFVNNAGQFPPFASLFFPAAFHLV